MCEVGSLFFFLEWLSLVLVIVLTTVIVLIGSNVVNQLQRFHSFQTERNCFSWAFPSLLRPEFMLCIRFIVFMVNVWGFLCLRNETYVQVHYFIHRVLCSCLNACCGSRSSNKSTWNLEILKRRRMMNVCKGFFSTLEKVIDCTWLLIGHFTLPHVVPSCEADACMPI